MRQTPKMMDMEAEMRISMSVYLHMKAAAEWTLDEMRADLESRTGIPISLTTLSNWTRGMGYAKAQAAQQAWSHGLIREAALEARAESGRRARERARVSARRGSLRVMGR